MKLAYGDVPLKRIRLSKPQERLLRSAAVGSLGREGIVLKGGALRSSDTLVDYGLVTVSRQARRGGYVAVVTDRGRRFLRRYTRHVEAWEEPAT